MVFFGQKCLCPSQSSSTKEVLCQQQVSVKLCCFTLRCSFWRLWLQRQMDCSNLLAQKRLRSSVIAPWYHPIRDSPYSRFFVCFRQDIWYRKASCFKNACWFCQIISYLSSIPSLFQLLQVVWVKPHALY